MNKRTKQGDPCRGQGSSSGQKALRLPNTHRAAATSSQAYAPAIKMDVRTPLGAPPPTPGALGRSQATGPSEGEQQTPDERQGLCGVQNNRAEALVSTLSRTQPSFKQVRGITPNEEETEKQPSPGSQTGNVEANTPPEKKGSPLTATAPASAQNSVSKTALRTSLGGKASQNCPFSNCV